MTIDEAESILIPNLPEVLHRFSDSKDFMDSIIKKFPEDPVLESFRESSKTDDWEKILLHVHTIKGTSGNFGFEKLFNISAAMVTAIRAKDFSLAKNLAPQVLQEIDAVCNILLQVE